MTLSRRSSESKLDATGQDKHLFRTHDAEQPPATRRRKDARTVIGDDAVILADAELADSIGKHIGRGHHMRETGGMIRDFVVIETHGTGNMPCRIFGICIAVVGRQVEGGVDDSQIRASELVFEPLGRNDETAGVAHVNTPTLIKRGIR